MVFAGERNMGLCFLIKRGATAGFGLRRSSSWVFDRKIKLKEMVDFVLRQ